MTAETHEQKLPWELFPAQEILNCNEHIVRGSLQTSLRVKDSRGTGLSVVSHRTPCTFIELCHQELAQVLTVNMGENILPMTGTGRAKGSILKYTRAPCSSERGLPSGETN